MVKVVKQIGQKKELFFALLRNALWYTEDRFPKELSLKEALHILRGAEMQAVSGLVIDALIRNNVRMPKKMLLESFTLLEKIKQQNQFVNEGVKALQQLFGKNGVMFVIVKGQVVASYYPASLLRQSGDIDYYCNTENFSKSQQVIKEAWGIETNANGSDFHVHFDYKDIIYEGHFSLISLYGKNKDDYWLRLLAEDRGDTVRIGDVDVPTLSPTLHTLFVFLHLYHHLMELGVGLRQFCDLAVMLHYCHQNIDMDAFRLHLKNMGLEGAFRACCSILTDYLGLPENEIGYMLSSRDRQYGKKILNVVFYRGNMGHYNKQNGFSGWKHKIESFGIKTSHFVKFMPLAPRYSYGWMWHKITRQVH